MSHVVLPCLLTQCLQLQAEPQRRAHAQANARGELWVGVAEGIRDKDVYLEFVNAQVKVSPRCPADELSVFSCSSS